jgi:unsaturated chondroitin disaccharide hydrolase
VIETAIATALKTIDGNIDRFAHQYPADATETGIYPVRRARHGYAAGSHTGWTTGFWAGQLWLSYDVTQDAKYW